MSWAATVVRSWPLKVIDPLIGRSRPEMVRSVVVLPAPLVPMRRDDLALVDVEADPLDGLDLAVGDLEVLDLQHGAHALSSSSSSPPM